MMKRQTMVSDSNKQTGVVLVVTLISLAILLIAGVALIRTTSNSLFISGNLAFKRDLINESDIAVPIIKARFLTGDLSTVASREQHIIAANYYASTLPTNSSGIPNVLLTELSTFDSTYPSNNISPQNSGVTIRYVLDRLCQEVGKVNANSLANCQFGSSTTNLGGDVLQVGKNGATVQGAYQLIYRLSMRITGPRNTETFTQLNLVY